MEKAHRRHGRSGRTLENKRRQMEKLYNSNEKLQKIYPNLDNFLALLKKASPGR